jgi:hypothetical protein
VRFGVIVCYRVCYRVRFHVCSMCVTMRVTVSFTVCVTVRVTVCVTVCVFVCVSVVLVCVVLRFFVCMHGRAWTCMDEPPRLQVQLAQAPAQMPLRVHAAARGCVRITVIRLDLFECNPLTIP